MKQKINLKYHLFFWCFYLLASVVSEGGYGTSLTQVLLFEVLALPFKLLLVYLNWFYLVPRFFDLKNSTNYLLLAGVTLIAFTFGFRYYSMKFSFPLAFPEFTDLNMTYFLPYTLVRILLVFLILFVVTTCWQFYIDWLEKQRIANLLKIEKRETELKYLKSQVNPHFLFNTLNTIYSLSLEKSVKVPKLLLKLSDFLSFSLYETSQETISIHKEVALIENFIELQKDRFVDRVAVEKKVTIDDQFLQIPPMLLITFIENAFKHSLKNEIGTANIYIELLAKGGSLTFLVRNSKSDETGKAEKEKGIGLKNIRRRLDLIYGNQYSLDIDDAENTFQILLQLKVLPNEI